MPVVQISPEFTIDSVYNNLDDYNFGLMIDQSLAEELELTDTPGIKLIPSQTCLTTVISSEGAGHIMASMLHDAVNYMEDNGMKMCGNAWGSTIGSYSEGNIHKRYHEIYIPIEFIR
ncbi:hypothetical protein OXPF_33900 [Oxobacter pfennigii]|uniref:Integron-associated effector binding protein domain-containing protein n=2 Tax=Oxobacter pfennigii TaxID=36849 RepID=A0A0P8WXR9_9CLOT|nr:hypothetical protein OXPF_33900 [Oxobacter pfennigii]